jgi:hypothetical protein
MRRPGRAVWRRRLWPHLAEVPGGRDKGGSGRSVKRWQLGSQTHQQVGDADRLDEVVAGAAVQAVEPVLIADRTGQQENGDPQAAPTQLPAEVVAVGQAAVEQDGVVGGVGAAEQGLGLGDGRGSIGSASRRSEVRSGAGYAGAGWTTRSSTVACIEAQSALASS